MKPEITQCEYKIENILIHNKKLGETIYEMR